MKCRREKLLTKISPRGKPVRSRLPARVKNVWLPEILDSCARKEISPPIALLKLMFIGRHSADLEAIVKLTTKAAAIQDDAGLAEVCALYEENRAACEKVMTMSQPEP